MAYDIFKNRKIFFYFVNICNDKYRFGHDLSLYREIIDKHKCNPNLESLLNDDEIYQLIIDTLRAWNMDQRGAILTTVDNFKQSVESVRRNLIKLSKYKIYLINIVDLEDDIIPLFKDIFWDLEVMESLSRLVGVSKALHFLLPDLVMPIDNKYTKNYFGFSSSLGTEWDRFGDVLLNVCHITSQLSLTQNDVDGIGWNTSVPKLIDNAIIGFYNEIEEVIKRYGDDAKAEFLSKMKRIESEKD
jgi:hypothetical protein